MTYSSAYAPPGGDRRNVVQVYFVSFYTSPLSIPSFFVRRRYSSNISVITISFTNLPASWYSRRRLETVFG